jgi:hypothetical protein
MLWHLQVVVELDLTAEMAGTTAAGSGAKNWRGEQLRLMQQAC